MGRMRCHSVLNGELCLSFKIKLLLLRGEYFVFIAAKKVSLNRLIYFKCFCSGSLLFFPPDVTFLFSRSSSILKTMPRVNSTHNEKIRQSTPLVYIAIPLFLFQNRGASSDVIPNCYNFELNLYCVAHKLR